jgi:Flp pilus assembly protein TadG
VEFALIAPPLFLLLFGTIEFGRLLWTREAIYETAISAARCMGILGSSCTASGTYSSTKTTIYVQTVAKNWEVSVPTSGITLDSSTTCGGITGFSKVTIDYTFQSPLAKLLKALSGGIALTASACFPNQP